MMIQFKTGLNPEANEVLKGILYPRSGNEAEHDEKLLTLYSHSSAASLSEKTPLPKEETDMISEELTKYRTKTYRATFVKPYEVFTNAQRYRIATYGASSLEDLANLKCLNKDQLEKYGEDILEILRRIEEKQ
jgi:superfamily II DNA helicase RecQ